MTRVSKTDPNFGSQILTPVQDSAIRSQFSVLAFPFRYLIPTENVLSSYFLDLIAAYTIVLERQIFEKASEIQVHFEIVPQILKNIQKVDSPKDAECAITALSQFLAGKRLSNSL